MHFVPRRKLATPNTIATTFCHGPIIIHKHEADSHMPALLISLLTKFDIAILLIFWLKLGFVNILKIHRLQAAFCEAISVLHLQGQSQSYAYETLEIAGVGNTKSIAGQNKQ